MFERSFYHGDAVGNFIEVELCGAFITGRDFVAPFGKALFQLSN